MTKWEVTCITSQSLNLHIGTGLHVSDMWTQKGKDGTTTFDVVVQHAEEGWELVNVTPINEDGTTRYILFTFKRPIENN